MPDVTATIDSIDIAAQGKSAKGPWTLYKVKAGGYELTTLNGAQVSLLRDIQERNGAAFIEYEEQHKDGYINYRIKEVKGPVEAPEDVETGKPTLGENGSKALGTGEYVKGQTAPKDRRGMNAATSLNNAVAALSHTVRADNPGDGLRAIEQLWGRWFDRLNEMGGLVEQRKMVAEEDIPF